MAAYTKTAWVNGGAPAISAANLGKIESALSNSVGLDTITELKALAVPTAIFSVRTLGHTTANDGGGGLFWWDSGSAEADNNGTIIIPDSAPANGRWKRLFDGPVSIKWFGAKGDGTADDTAAIQAAFNTGKAVDMPTGTYKITAKLSITTRDQYIRGDGLKTIIRQTSSNTDAIVIESGTSAGVNLENFLIQAGSGATFTTGGVGVRTEYAGDLRFNRISVSQMFSAFYIDTRTHVSTSDVWLFQCKAFDCKSAGFDVNKGTQIYFEKCDALSCERGFRFTDGSAYHMLDCLSLFNETHGVQFLGTQVDWVFLNQVECDASGVDGFRFENCRGFHLANCWAGSSGAEGYSFISGNEQFYASTCSSMANDNHGWALSGIDGFFASSCNGNENNKDTATARAGFFIGTGASNIVLEGCDASSLAVNVQTYGIEIAGSADKVRVLGGRAQGNNGEQVRITTSGEWSVQDVIGFLTRNKGSATIANGSAVVAVNHGLSRTPTSINITPKADYGSLRMWVSNINATSFQISMNTTTTVDLAFFWQAQV